MFQRYNDVCTCTTPLQLVCTRSCELEKEKRGVHEIFVINFITKTLDDSDMKLNSEDALVSAILDDTIHLDCVYFLLRRKPDILQKLLSP